MSVHVLLNLLNEFSKIYKKLCLRTILSLFATQSITSIKFEHEC